MLISEFIRAGRALFAQCDRCRRRVALDLSKFPPDLDHTTLFGKLKCSSCGNREVLAINQDPLGKAARRVWADNWTQVWARPLADGTVSVGLFNRAPDAMPVTVTFADIGITQQRPPIRFPWTHQDLGVVGGSGREYTTTVPRHGAVLLKIGNPTKAVSH